MTGGKFVQAFGEVCTKTDWQVHAVCMMGNHFHMVVETPRTNRVAAMKWVSGDLHQGRLRISPLRGGAALLQPSQDALDLDGVPLGAGTGAGGNVNGVERADAKLEAAKLAIASRLRREATMTLKWISQRLALGPWMHLNKRAMTCFGDTKPKMICIVRSAGVGVR